MSASTLNFTGDLLAAEQGSRFLHQITLTTNGTPIDISADGFAFTVTTGWGAASSVLALTVGSGITILDGPNGVLTIDVAETTMKGVSAGTDYVYDFARIPGGTAANRYVVFRGQFEVRPSAKAGA